MERTYIDLGLPSGTLWADENEEGFFRFPEAKELFGASLPSDEQMEELHLCCRWDWDDERKGYLVTGTSGNSIFLPAAGVPNMWFGKIGKNVVAGKIGKYWTGSYWQYFWRHSRLYRILHPIKINVWAQCLIFTPFYLTYSPA